MTLKEFYEQIDSDYKDVIKRLCDEDMIKKFVFKFPRSPQEAPGMKSFVP